MLLLPEPRPGQHPAGGTGRARFRVDCLPPAPVQSSPRAPALACGSPPHSVAGPLLLGRGLLPPVPLPPAQALFPTPSRPTPVKAPVPTVGQDSAISKPSGWFTGAVSRGWDGEGCSSAPSGGEKDLVIFPLKAAGGVLWMLRWNQQLPGGLSSRGPGFFPQRLLTPRGGHALGFKVMGVYDL